MRSVTITLTERDALALQKQLEQWLVDGSGNTQARQAFTQIEQQIKYQTQEQTTTARG